MTGAGVDWLTLLGVTILGLGVLALLSSRAAVALATSPRPLRSIRRRVVCFSRRHADGRRVAWVLALAAAVGALLIRFG